MDKDERERGSACPKLPQFQCRVFGDDPVAEPRGRRRRPHHRIRRQQQRSPRSPELQRSPREANCSKTNSPTAALLRAQRVALSTARQWIKMSAREGQRAINAVFQCRLLATTPYLAARRHHRRRRRGGRSSNNNHSNNNNNNIIIISVRRERPSSIVRPQPDSSTAQPSTSPSCGQQPLHRPGGSSRSSSIAGRPFPFWGGLFGTCLWVPPIVAIGRSAAHGASGSVRSRVALSAGRSADRARRGAALAHARRFGATQVNGALYC